MPHAIKPPSRDPAKLNGLAERLITLDMYEQSHHMDFGAKAGAYVDAFMNNLTWTAAEAAFAKRGA